VKDSEIPHDVTKGAPSGYFLVVPQRDDQGAIDLQAAVATLLSSWKLLMAVTLVAAVIAGVISLQMRKVYRAQTIIVPVLQGNGGLASNLGGQFGGLAALAGIDVGANGSRKEEAFATLSSTGFVRDFIVAEKLMPVLFEERWDDKAQQWRAGEKPPSLEAAVKTFLDIRFVTEDRRTGIVTVMVEWYSPEVAARWANRMVEMANERLRAESREDAQRSIDYLNQELAKTNVIELRQAIYRLIETQVNNAMLANVQREFAFRVIDPAVPPELRIRPRRSLMVLMGAAAGFAVAVLFVLGRRLIRREP
jgi:LPS O-antigen subunit length determinant protein (WzzB/FepE family)